MTGVAAVLATVVERVRQLFAECPEVCRVQVDTGWVFWVSPGAVKVGPVLEVPRDGRIVHQLQYVKERWPRVEREVFMLRLAPPLFPPEGEREERYLGAVRFEVRPAAVVAFRDVHSGAVDELEALLREFAAVCLAFYLTQCQVVEV